VASAIRENVYDLRDYVERNWRTLGPQLVGKLPIAAGDMNKHFLNLGVYRMEALLESPREERRRP